MKRHSNHRRAARRLAVAGTVLAAGTVAVFLPAIGATPAAAQPGSDDKHVIREVRMRAPHARRAMRGMDGMDRMGGAWDRLLAHADELQLTDAQQEKLRAIRRSAPGALMPKRQAIAEARLDLADLIAKKDASAQSLRQAHERLVQARGTLANATFDLRMQAREVLTQKQRDQLRELGRRGGGRREGRRGDAWMPGDEPEFGALVLDELAPDFDAGSVDPDLQPGFPPDEH